MILLMTAMIARARAISTATTVAVLDVLLVFASNPCSCWSRRHIV